MSMEQVNVFFTECDAGWIIFKIFAGSQAVRCRASEVYDPFPKMMAWLEAIASGAETCSFIMDEEGRQKEFKACGCGSGNVRLTIIDPFNNQILLEAVVDMRQCVGAFYHPLRAFAKSEAYVATQWEAETLGERLQAQSGRTEEDVLKECCDMSAEELIELFFRAAPSYDIVFLDAKTPKEKIAQFVQFTMHPEEMEHPERVIEVPSHYKFPEEFDYWLVDQRREFIVTCFRDCVSSYSGCRLRELVSDKLEAWLT